MTNGPTKHSQDELPLRPQTRTHALQIARKNLNRTDVKYSAPPTFGLAVDVWAAMAAYEPGMLYTWQELYELLPANSALLARGVEGLRAFCLSGSVTRGYWIVEIDSTGKTFTSKGSRRTDFIRLATLEEQSGLTESEKARLQSARVRAALRAQPEERPVIVDAPDPEMPEIEPGEIEATMYSDLREAQRAHVKAARDYAFLIGAFTGAVISQVIYWIHAAI